MNVSYAVITSAFGTGPLLHVIISRDEDPDEALRMAREVRDELRGGWMAKSLRDRLNDVRRFIGLPRRKYKEYEKVFRMNV